MFPLKVLFCQILDTTEAIHTMKNVFCLGAPPVNPLNGKAQKLPIINPFNKYGRVFFFSWASFCACLPDVDGEQKADYISGQASVSLLGIPLRRWLKVFERPKVLPMSNGSIRKSMRKYPAI
jgi:hypothetical protein